MNLYSLKPEEYKALILSVGSHTRARPLTPVEAARLFARMRAAGATLQDCARAVRLDGATMVARFLRLLELPLLVQDVVDWGQTGVALSFTAAAELTRLPRDERERAYELILENRLSAAETKQVVQRRLRSTLTLEACVDEIVALRPQLVRQHVFVGSLTDQRVREAARTLPQRVRDAWITRAVAAILPTRVAVNARLGSERFVLVATDEDAVCVRKLVPDFESVVNMALEETTVPERVMCMNTKGFEA